MSATENPVPPLSQLLDGFPKNWGRWGPDDEIGSLNFLTPETIVEAARLVKSGKVFTLQVPMADPAGDPMWPGARSKPQRVNVIDKGHYMSGKMPGAPGGIEGCDDMIVCYLQGSTQYDALGHAWFGDQLYNGYDSRTTIGSMTKASILPVAQRGIVGRGVLFDIARLRGKEHLERGETYDHDDLMAAAARQGVEVRKHDVVLVHTGWVKLFYKDQEKFYGAGQGWLEPGLTLSRGLVDWFHDMEIPNLVTDTLANEVTVDPVTGAALPLHVALMSNLGVLFTEIASLHDLAADCAADGVYEFLYVAAPLKVVGAAGSPVNPVAIK
jgi:kynurenine formamidase